MSKLCIVPWLGGPGEAHPDAALVKLLQGFFFPSIKRTHHIDSSCIGRIGAELHIAVFQVRSEVFVGIEAFFHVEFCRLITASF